LKHFTSTFPDQPWETEIKLYNRKLKVSVSKSQHPNILQKGERKYEKKKKKNQQCHNLCGNDYKANSTTELLLKDRCNDCLNSMPLFPVWNESWIVTRHGNKTSDGEGKIKFEYKLQERQ